MSSVVPLATVVNVVWLSCAWVRGSHLAFRLRHPTDLEMPGVGTRGVVENIAVQVVVVGIAGGEQ